jgi:hypothetical protein
MKIEAEVKAKTEELAYVILASTSTLTSFRAGKRS